MKNICVGMALLFFVLFSSSCVISQQGKIQTSANNHPQNKHSEQSKKADKTENQEDGMAEYNLGEKYFEGHGVPKDYTEAVKWYRKAAEIGNPNAQYKLGRMYQGFGGKGVPTDIEEAFKWYRMAAERGLVEAQVWLGSMYYDGIGVPQDYTKAAKWCRKGAEQGDANAQLYLGSMYEYGHGVSQDYAEAAGWYRKAAEQGYDTAQFNLGNMYSWGKGVPQDYAKAAEWYRKAAEQGFTDARFRLGKLLEKTDYPGWECLNMSDTEYHFINKNKIRRQGNLVWYWTMNVPFQESHSDEKCTKCCLVADCDSARLRLVSYIKYDSNDEVLDSHTFKESEIDMKPVPVPPGSIGESTLEYACSHAKAETYKKEETEKTGACFGTGWSVASGFVVTNNHVVEGRNHITLIRPDGVKIPATVAAHDAFNDLALLKVEDVGLLPAALPLSSKPAALGEKVVTIGYPHPDLLGVKPKLTEGVVNSTSGLGDDPRALQISVPIQAGNSGGPLLNMEGKVWGLLQVK